MNETEFKICTVSAKVCQFPHIERLLSLLQFHLQLETKTQQLHSEVNRIACSSIGLS